MTLALDWEHQYKAALEVCSEKADMIHAAPATTGMKVEMERSGLLGSLRHTFCVAPYCQTQLAGIDRYTYHVLREAYGMHRTTSKDKFFTSRDRGGMGHEALPPVYQLALTEHFFAMLNDQGRLGALARGSMLDILASAPPPTRQGGPHPTIPPPSLTSGHKRDMLHRMYQWILDYPSDQESTLRWPATRRPRQPCGSRSQRPMPSSSVGTPLTTYSALWLPPSGRWEYTV